RDGWSRCCGNTEYAADGRDGKARPWPGRRISLGSGELFQRLLDGFLGDEAYDLLLHLSAFEDQQGWDAAHAIALRRGSVAIHVHFGSFYLALIRLCDLIHHRGKSAAGTAPGGPEIDQHRLLTFEHLLIEVSVSDFQNCFARHSSSRFLVQRLVRRDFYAAGFMLQDARA